MTDADVIIGLSYIATIVWANIWVPALLRRAIDAYAYAHGPKMDPKTPTANPIGFTTFEPADADDD